MHLQQSLNKLGVVLEERGGMEKEGGAASVQLVGRTQVLQAWVPVLWGTSEPVWPG